jgi:predicted DNA-binding protein (MmcQ/YjbR family)
MYAVTGVEGPFTVSLKLRPKSSANLPARDGIVPAPYMARKHWVLVEDQDRTFGSRVEKYLQQSYELVKSKLPKKLQKELGC